jgi:ribokinase
MAFMRKVPVVLNPSPMADISHEILQKVSYLVLNEVEAKGISGMDVVDIETARSAAKKILSTGTENVIITLGENGAVFASHSTSAHVPAIKVKPIDTTAAGDAFTAGFVTGILKGFPLIDAVRYGNCAGALTATRNGAQTSLPDCAAVDELFYSGRTEI